MCIYIYIWICTLNTHLTVTVVFVPLNYYALRHLISWSFIRFIFPKDTKEVLNKQIAYVMHDYFIQHMCLISEITSYNRTYVFNLRDCMQLLDMVVLQQLFLLVVMLAGPTQTLDSITATGVSNCTCDIRGSKRIRTRISGGTEKTSWHTRQCYLEV